MTEKIYETPLGAIHYWTNDFDADRKTLVLLPGLTADHALFDKQIEAFAPEYNLLVWDAPGHGASRPFELTFPLMDKAVWLHEILEQEGIDRPILIGQSMGGYVAQCFMERYPGKARGFISIDSAPLQKKFMTGTELAALRRTGRMLRSIPWSLLLRQTPSGCAETAAGRAYMREQMLLYGREAYCRLADHGYSILADAIEAGLPYAIDCPALLICGGKDSAGFVRKYNYAWFSDAGIDLIWIRHAGHNANMDAPERVNEIIADFVLNGIE